MLYEMYDSNDKLQTIQFIEVEFKGTESKGSIVKHGVTVNTVLFMLKKHVEYLDSVLPCAENKAILEHLVSCISLVIDRENKRVKQGVIHTLQEHVQEEDNGISFNNTFGEALEAIKLGHAVSRKHWKGMCVMLQGQNSNTPSVMPVIIKFTGETTIPFVPDQLELLANDWIIFK
jgi:hypothetical protein